MWRYLSTAAVLAVLAAPALSQSEVERPRLPIGQLLQLVPPEPSEAAPGVATQPTLRIAPLAEGVLAARPRLDPRVLSQLALPQFTPAPLPPTVTFQYVPAVVPPVGAPAPTAELTLCNATGQPLWVAVFLPGGGEDLAGGKWIDLAAEGEQSCGRLPPAAIRSAAFYYGLSETGLIEGEAPFCFDFTDYAFLPKTEEDCPEGFVPVGFREVLLDYPWVTEEIAAEAAGPAAEDAPTPE